jgi:nucleoside-diphosphate-sugar epimerase
MVKPSVLVTGSQGFIGSYICSELLSNGYRVIGVDNYSKYGQVRRVHDSHENFDLVKGDVCKISELIEQDFQIDYIIAGAAMIGGISYFHKYAYDLLATNERIMAATFDFAIDRYKKGLLKRIIVLSSSMVFECATAFPTAEAHVKECPAPFSTYGFQKLASEYFCKGAYEQYGLPYTIIRPFNCVGVGEDEILNVGSMSEGDQKVLMSHVLPDLIYKALKFGSDAPLSILGSGEQIRHYTNGRDLARGIRIAMESEAAVNEDFNISSSQSTTVKELAQIIWSELYGDKPLKFSHLEPYEYDVQLRQPDVSKAEKVLDVTCDTPLEETVREVIQYLTEICKV